MRAGPVNQVEVNVAQIEPSQAAEGSFRGSLALVLWTQFTAERLVTLRNGFRRRVTVRVLPDYENILSSQTMFRQELLQGLTQI